MTIENDKIEKLEMISELLKDILATAHLRIERDEIEITPVKLIMSIVWDINTAVMSDNEGPTELLAYHEDKN